MKIRRGIEYSNIVYKNGSNACSVIQNIHNLIFAIIQIPSVDALKIAAFVTKGFVILFPNQWTINFALIKRIKEIFVVFLHKLNDCISRAWKIVWTFSNVFESNMGFITTLFDFVSRHYETLFRFDKYVGSVWSSILFLKREVPKHTVFGQK